MHQTLVIGAGNIGSLITFLLARSNDYYVYLADQLPENPQKNNFASLSNYEYVKLDANNEASISDYIKKNNIQSVVSSLPYFCNAPIARVAAKNNINYFDLTEDVQTSDIVLNESRKATSAFVPQCGLAPGYINIIANHLMKQFPILHTVKLRTGALPINISNELHYSLTWSTDGLINEYGNPCKAIQEGKEVMLQPLEDIETIHIDGLTYEAFNTSGGLGSLADTYKNKVVDLNYKTIRYPGHRDKMHFLMQDLKLNQDRSTLKKILENALPKISQDVVLIYVSVTGIQNNIFVEENYVKKFYPKTLDGLHWSAIQFSTASSITSIIDVVVKNPEKFKGFIKQEDFSLEALVSNQFGKYFV